MAHEIVRIEIVSCRKVAEVVRLRDCFYVIDHATGSKGVYRFILGPRALVLRTGLLAQAIERL
jgi:hypothetical protein